MNKPDIHIPEAYSLKDLLYLMERLRDPETGCPWDIKQSWQSITASTIEEAYEVVEAIESEDRSKIKEELGDLLFQVVFYSRFAEEEGSFNFYQVVHTLTDKLVSRHPHVFPGASLCAVRDAYANITENSVNQSWESIKKRERGDRGQQGVLADIATNLPALARAEKLQKRAARSGFDWEHVDQVIDKLNEEITELKETLQEKQNKQAQEAELGDVLFSCVNLARFAGLDCEKALRQANRKFEARVSWVEKQMASEGRELESCSSAELDQYWQRAKNSGL